jgi:hypothetical protein
MKKALISTYEPRESGYRVAQVEDEANIFPIADWLMWVDCPDDIVADKHWYNPNSKEFIAFPEQILNPTP